MTQRTSERARIIESVRRGDLGDPIVRIAEKEGIGLNEFTRGIIEGEIVVFSNRLQPVRKKPCAVGRHLRTKVNANIGTSPELCDPAVELEKLRVAQEAGADAVMDLSTGGNLTQIRKELLAASQIPFGTVPVYDLISHFCAKGRPFRDAAEEDFLDVVRTHGEAGVDFVTIHAGVTQAALACLKKQGRVSGIVSRGGSFIAEWMLSNKRENPYYARFDELLEIACHYDLVISLGDGLRPGAVRDATDRAQIEELITLGELQQRALSRDVQVIIEGPGHVPLDQIEANVILEKKLCHGAPFYVLGPLVTDVAPGYDHITSAIGGALAARYGADFLCYVTPGEHLRLPTKEDVRDGVIASRIAAHAADLVKLGSKARAWDDAIAAARFARDWQNQIQLALDPEKVRTLISKDILEGEGCTMCGEFCAYKVSERIIENKKKID